MSARSCSLLAGIASSVLTVFFFMLPCAWAQHGSEGTLSVTVVDPSGSVVAGADLELTDLATGNSHKAVTGSSGSYTFVNLNLGTYRLSISRSGFQNQVFENVIAQAARTTSISAILKVGTQNETVEVNSSASPVIEDTSNAIGTTVDLKEIESLPLFGRDLTALSRLVPGYTGSGNNGTWDGLPAIAQGNNIDGVIGSSSRMKFGGNAQPAVVPRLEDIQEMTVQTEQLDLNQGFGQANMQINFVTRRGTNRFHGRVFEDFRNTALDANSWLNNAATALNPSNPLPKNHLVLNEFGGSLGGPILRNKLFFFGTFGMAKQPGTATATNYVLTPAAQQGNFTYVGTDGTTHTLNLLMLARNYNTTHPGANLPTALDSAGTYSPGNVLQSINASLKYGNLTPNALGDPNLQTLTWQEPNPNTWYYPTVRADYTPSARMRFNIAWNMTKRTSPGANVPDFPGPAWSKTGAGYVNKNYTAAFGFDYTISPNLINDFRGGFLYNAQIFANGAPPLTLDAPQLGWNYSGVPQPFNTQMSGTIFYTATGNYYPIFNASDTMTWQRSSHTMNFGFSWWRELDHYYNGVLGFPGVSFGLANGDPAQSAFQAGSTMPNATATEQTTAQQLYAILVGRVSTVGGSYTYQPSGKNYCTCIGAYNLDELSKGWGLFFQDSYRIRRDLTLNYGLRWDFTAADRDTTNLYHSVDEASMWGPSGVGNLFNPGVLKAPNLVPQLRQISQAYNNWNVSPQPGFGFAWNPRGTSNTVIRGGFSLRKFTEPQQYVWNQASDYGSFYYQSFFLNATCSTSPNCPQGTYVPGTLAIGNYNASAWRGLYGRQPQTFLPTEPMSDFTFLGGPGLFGIKYNIQQPYTESWNLGVQRQLGESRALEVRYVGSRTLRQWIPIATDEINIFENGFLTQFKAAQQNLAINKARGINSFANNGFAGQQPTPIFDAAFAGEGSGGPGVPLRDYAAANFITDLNNGEAGLMASNLAGVGAAPYFCNLVGSGFAPCANNLKFTKAGAGYPINFFQTNPYAQGTGFGYPSLTEAAGYSNYNAAQIDFRQRAWHGLQFDANYVWSHTLGIGSQNNWQGEGALFTIRNMRLSYGPSLFDLRHVVHISGNYDLPFGKSKTFLNNNSVLDRVVGGWTIGTIFTFQTGYPFLLGSGSSYRTFNDFADAGVVLNGVTASQLQSAVGVYRVPGTTQVSLINPRYLASPKGGGANPAYILPNTTPGTIGQRVWLYGPHQTFDDMAITKNFVITERMHFNLQAEMLNAFNHPVFSPGFANGSTYTSFGGGFSPLVRSTAFGLVRGAFNPNTANTTTAGARLIELRANLEF
jgi:hypothetical protein